MKRDLHREKPNENHHTKHKLKKQVKVAKNDLDYCMKVRFSHKSRICID